MLGERGTSGPGSAAALTSFLGRSEEIATALRLLGTSRLLTLVGPPGTGKTRLADEVAKQAGASFADGVRVVSLAEVHHLDDLPNEVAAALAVTDAPGVPLVDSVVSALRAAELLLVLDNCEHLAAPVASFVQHILSTAPGVRVLATSRTPLAVPGEQLSRVPPLPRETAVELFVDRSRLVADLVLDAEGRDYVERICRRVDGIPLAVELAAGQTRAFSLAEIATRLGTDLRELEVAGSPGTDRRTMTDTIAWSCRLLNDEQLLLLEQVSVFAGGFDLAAVEAVADPGLRVPQALSALVDHSLVLADPEPSGAMRYRLLEPIRQYAERRLEEGGGSQDVRARHAWHYRSVVRGADRNLLAAADLRWDDALRRDERNVLTAIAWARDLHSDLALQLTTGMGGYWDHRGLSNEALARVERFMHHGPVAPRPRAEALLVLSQFRYRQGDYARAERDAHEAWEILRGLDDEDAVARSLAVLSQAAGPRQESDAATPADSTDAVRAAEQSAAIFAARGDPVSQAWAQIILGAAHYGTGSPARAAAAHAEALTLLDQVAPSPAISGRAHLGIALECALRRDVAGHRARLQQAIRDLDQVGRLAGDYEWLWAAVSLARNEGRMSAALRLAGAARAIGRRGNRLPPVSTEVCHEAVAAATERIGRNRAARLLARGEELTTGELVADALAPPRDTTLSARELEVARLTGQGLTNAEIAGLLHISRRTVETHQVHIREKLGVASRHEVMAWAMTEESV